MSNEFEKWWAAFQAKEFASFEEWWEELRLGVSAYPAFSIPELDLAKAAWEAARAPEKPLSPPLIYAQDYFLAQRDIPKGTGICDACDHVVPKAELKAINTPTLAGVMMCKDCYKRVDDCRIPVDDEPGPSEDELYDALVDALEDDTAAMTHQEFGEWLMGLTDEVYEESRCTLPPYGWRCTRTPGHVNPCAAIKCSRKPPRVSPMACCGLISKDCVCPDKLPGSPDPKGPRPWYFTKEEWEQQWDGKLCMTCKQRECDCQLDLFPKE